MIIYHGFQNGWCPLTYAAYSGHIAVVDTLLQYGATVDKAKDVSVMDDLNYEHSHAAMVFEDQIDWH